MSIEFVTRKTFTIRESGRSTDFITPSFGFGCLAECSYCYMKRHVNDKTVSIAKNTHDILTAINNHVMWLPPKTPNQTDPVYYTMDISCNEDLALHLKHHNWRYIFDFFKNHKKVKASFATKFVIKELLTYNPNQKVRIRFSLMPQIYADLLEPISSPIKDRIEAIDKFIDAGYEVHINFSPVIVHDGWLEEYEKLFTLVNEKVKNKDKVKCEVIFLTHNRDKHNIQKDHPGEHLIWKPSIQETKNSQYGGENIRYKHYLKSQYIEQFKKLHDSIIPWNTIRYIF